MAGKSNVQKRIEELETQRAALTAKFDRERAELDASINTLRSLPTRARQPKVEDVAPQSSQVTTGE